ncbi:MAG: signal peptidase I [Eubacterium sp.]|nr:signal peptidase I [Eubacterium sp.]
MKRKAKEEKKALKQKLKEEKAEAAEEKKATKKKKSDKSENPEDINIVKDLVSVLIYMLVIVVLCLLIVTFVGQRTTVNGDSMNPTLENGDNLWIDKFSYRFKDPQRYDIIVFPQQDVFYIKRVIGLPGETVKIDAEGHLYINGELVQDEYSQITIHNADDVGGDGITLGEGEYFVMGDNRNNSHDSRDQNVVGNITKKRMIGKAVFRLTPFSKFGSIYK